MKKLRVTVEGKNYDVLVEVLNEGSPAATVSAPPRPVISAPVASAVSAPVAAPATVAANGSSPGDVTSPLSGKLVSIDVTVGQSVAEGAQVATVEAMKMNTYIFAPKGGRVTALVANPGEAVQEGAVLLKIG